MATWQYHPLLVLFQLGVLVSAGVVLYCLRYVRRHGASTLVVAVGLLSFNNAVWVLAASLKVASVDLSTKVLFYKLEFLGSAVNPSVALVLALAYVGHQRWLTRTTYLALAIVPAVTIPLLLLNPGEVMILDPTLVSAQGIQALEHEFTPLFTLFLAWSLGVTLLAGAIVGHAAVAGRVPWKPAVLVSLTLLMPVAVVSLKVGGIYPPGGEGINVTPMVNGLAIAFLAIAVVEYRVFDLTPVGRGRVIDVMEDGYVLVDADGEIADANTAARNLLGRASDERLTGRPVTDVVPVYDDLDPDTSSLTFAVDDRTIQVTATELTSLAETAGRVLLLRDVTLRQMREEELERQNDRLGALFANTPAAVVEYVIEDDDPIAVAVNDSFEDIFGHGATEVVGNSVDDYIVPPNRTEEASSLNDKVEAGEYFSREVDRRTPDGVRSFTLRNTPIDTDGKTRGYASYTDITQRKERERELQRYERIIENIPVGVYRNTPGPDGEIIFANEAMVDIFGADSKADLGGTSVADLYADPADRAAFTEKLRETGTVTDEELRMQTVDGEEIWTSASDRLVEVDGETYIEGAINDITERKEYQQRLEEQMDQLEVLNRLVRHDINNEMTIVIGMVEAVQTGLDDPEAVDRLDRVLAASLKVSELTHTARDLMTAMLSEDRDRHPVWLSRVIEQEVDSAAAAHEDAVVEIEGDLPAVQVLADDLLGSVFGNLLKNGIQHNDADEPRVTVSATETDDTVRVTVADNGPGIPEDRRARVFGKSERGLDSEGTGIGLYLVQSLVDSYEGSVQVDSNDPRGTVFTVELERVSTE